MKVCVDTTVLIDVLKDEFRDYQEKLYTAMAKKETLVTPTVVFAELMPQFKGNTKFLHLFLKDHRIMLKPLDTGSVIKSGERWMKYLRRKTTEKCPECGYTLKFKEHFLSDFYIGGFALTKCDMILTRDRGIYLKYFPELQGYENCLKK